jgi:hypothetical protein
MKKPLSFEEFEKTKSKDMANEYNRYSWVINKEEEYSIREISTHTITMNLYHQASLCYIEGLYLSCILSIGATIDQFIRQLVDPTYKQRNWIEKSNLDNAVEQKFITQEHEKEIHEFKYSIRDPVAHPKVPVFGMLGLPYDKKKGYWGGEHVKPVLTGPKPSAERGLELFWKVVNYYFYIYKKGAPSQ